MGEDGGAWVLGLVMCALFYDVRIRSSSTRADE